MRVSVVVCTYNRADGLRTTLSSLRLQRFRDFEVVVVNGPSTDRTAEMLATEFHDQVRVVENPLANLSVSRNLGIAAAAGDLIAFIDDDALPEPNWLEQAVPEFADAEIAGVGGSVLDHTGITLQYRYSASTRFGDPQFSFDVPFELCCVPGASTFPYLQGTNALFRRDRLIEIGMFDETFDFYLDETDVCCRLVDAGWRLRQLPNAVVHHKYLPSARRNQAKVVTNWFSIMRNRVYFGYRHGLLDSNELDLLDRAKAFRDYAVADAIYHEDMGAVPPGHVDATRRQCDEAIVEGMRLGRAADQWQPVRISSVPPSFSAFPIDRPDEQLRVVIVSSGYTPNVTGGIARFISDVAPRLAAAGHEVRVFARAEDLPTVDLEDGVWVHRLIGAPTPGLLPDAPPSIDAFATAAADELDRVGTWWEPDVVYGSLWDVELLGIARSRPALPVVPMLATPVAEVAQHEGWDVSSGPAYEHFVKLVRLERELIARAAGVHAISDAIVDTFERLYPGALRRSQIDVAHIGRADTAPPDGQEPIDPPLVLFVGRLEARKGIDTFLDATETVLASDPRVRVVVAGDDRRPGPDGLPYPDAWRRRGVPGGERLSFVGPVDDHRLDDLMQAASVVVMPSLYESFGLVAVEAMMHGRACVASDVGGIPELFSGPGEASLVPPADPAALGSAIVALLESPADRRAMGASARSRFERHLTIDAAARRLIEVLERRSQRTRVAVGAGTRSGAA
jgi:glycogen(starch) synthase